MTFVLLNVNGKIRINAWIRSIKVTSLVSNMINSQTCTNYVHVQNK